jgi:hypothetical protein
VPARSGAGGMPCPNGISQTVEAATVMPKTASSPWILRVIPRSRSRGPGAGPGHGSSRRWAGVRAVSVRRSPRGGA